MINLHQLEMFVCCAEQGSFSAAARKLGKAQSAISQGIANLEIDLNQTLFDRSTRKPTLTPQGQLLLQQAQAVLLQAQDLQATALTLNSDTETSLALLVDPALLLPKLYQILAEFSAQFSATTLSLHVENSDAINQHIRQGRGDIGLTLIDHSMPIGVELGYIGQLPFATVAHPEHPLAKLTSVGRGDLSSHRQLLLRSIDGKGISTCPTISPKLLWCNDFIAMSELTQQQLGWCYLPAHIAEPAIAQGRLMSLPIRFDLQQWSVPVDRVTALGSIKGPALLWLENALAGLLIEEPS
ncbi:LysR family transcriptional regulator [Ferrimonas senticii]|uniref:LysR family transcriptional regulator n=1 Tax=Ferrimonas senticii TaxID=394566 RepID=UPI00041B4A2A|nr:LysR family transcriptional regulator [Ferrimonas senticii]